MRSKLLLFILISVLIHVLLLSLVDIKPPEKKKQKPISVSVIEKPKPKPQPAPEPVKPEKTIEDIPIDEEIESKIDQMSPVPADGVDKAQKSSKDKQTQPEPKKNAEETEINTLEEPPAPVEVPKISKKDFDKSKLDSILNPDEVIRKYAEEGGSMDGTDYVSMQYVKLRYQSYFYKFARRLYQVWIYPRAAAYRGEHGTVRISFMIARDGMISSIKVLESSGYPDLDKEAILALKKTAGVPLPTSYELDYLKVDAFFKYVLGGGFVVY